MGSHRKNKTPSSQQRKSHPTSSSNLNGSNGNQYHHLDINHASAVSIDDSNQHYGGYDEDEDEDDGFDNTARTLDFSKLLQDVEGSLVGTLTSSFVAITGLLSSSPTPSAPAASSNNNDGSFRVSWKELVYLVLAIVILAGLSIFLGVAAGITISIHYFDTHSTHSFPRLEARERDFGPHQRVTTLDYTIASSNILYPSVEMASMSVEEENEFMDLTLGRAITMSESGQRSVLLVVEEIPPLSTMNGTNETHILLTPNSNVSDNSTIHTMEDDDSLWKGLYRPFRHRGPPDDRFQLSASKIHPTICSDGVTIGFDDWDTLKAAVEEANFLSAERFMKWNEYFASLDATAQSRWYDDIFNNHATDEDDLLGYYYDEDVVFTICPGTTLKARKGPIFINAENILVVCGSSEEYDNKRATQSNLSPSANMRSQFARDVPSCTIDVGGTHLAFGPHAKNVLVRGLLFRSATTSSLAFHQDGAQASFEDCIWVDNAGVHGVKYGAVADVNSTSSVNFFRCEIGSSLISVGNAGSGIPGGPGIGESGTPILTGLSGIAPGLSSLFSMQN